LRKELAAGIDGSTAAVAENPRVPPIMASHVPVKDDLI
jgi:hypothetical protein